jgi:hypothetical protein
MSATLAFRIWDHAQEHSQRIAGLSSEDGEGRWSEFALAGCRMNPDSAVAISAKSEEQTFHNEANRVLPLSGQRTSVRRLCIQIHDNGLPRTKKDCETTESDVFAIPGLSLASRRPRVSTAESGMNGAEVKAAKRMAW